MGVGGCEMKTIGYTCRSVALTVFGPGFNSRRLPMRLAGNGLWPPVSLSLKIGHMKSHMLR